MNFHIIICFFKNIEVFQRASESMSFIIRLQTVLNCNFSSLLEFGIDRSCHNKTVGISTVTIFVQHFCTHHFCNPRRAELYCRLMNSGIIRFGDCLVMFCLSDVIELQHPAQDIVSSQQCPFRTGHRINPRRRFWRSCQHGTFR